MAHYHPSHSTNLLSIFCSTASTDDPEEEISPYCETVFQTRRSPLIIEVRQQHTVKKEHLNFPTNAVGDMREDAVPNKHPPC